MLDSVTSVVGKRRRIRETKQFAMKMILKKCRLEWSTLSEPTHVRWWNVTRTKQMCVCGAYGEVFCLHFCVACTTFDNVSSRLKQQSTDWQALHSCHLCQSCRSCHWCRSRHCWRSYQCWCFPPMLPKMKKMSLAIQTFSPFQVSFELIV